MQNSFLTWVNNEPVQSESVFMMLIQSAWAHIKYRLRRSGVSTCTHMIYPFIHIQYHFLYPRVIWEKTPSCCKHVTEILLSLSFLKWSNFQSEIGFCCIRLDNRSYPSCSSGWQISGTWKWYSVVCHCSNTVSGAPIISHFSYRDSSPVWTSPEQCRAETCSKYQNINTGFSEALARDLPLLSLAICDKPSLWEHYSFLLLVFFFGWRFLVGGVFWFFFGH